MALSTCRDCGREVSTLARHCVHCGRPRPTGTCSSSVVAGIVAVVIALALTGAAVLVAKRACKKMEARASAECRLGDRVFECSSWIIGPRDADKATFIRSLERDGARLIEVKPGLFRIEAPTPEPQKEERK